MPFSVIFGVRGISRLDVFHIIGYLKYLSNFQTQAFILRKNYEISLLLSFHVLLN